MAKKKRSSGKKPEKKSKKDFVWSGLRISFWIMICLWLLSFIMELIGGNFYYSDSSFWVGLSVIWFFSVIFTFVISIIHLNRYKEKGFAVTALVISSILILLFLVGVMALLNQPPSPALE